MASAAVISTLIVAHLTKSAKAAELGLSNVPDSPEEGARLLYLATWEPAALTVVRTQFPQAYVTSAYRSDAVNDAVNGDSASYHRHGLALDVGGLGSWDNVTAAARALRSRRTELGPIRTVIAERRRGLHVHLDWFDPLGIVVSPRTSANFLEETQSGEPRYVQLRS